MANFNTKSFLKHDHYMTPKSAWENIKHLIPKGRLYDPFYGDGQSGKDLKDITNQDVFHEPIDFFDDEIRPEYDCCITNFPFSQSKQVFTKLLDLDKPFIAISPISKVCTQYFRKLFKNKIQIIIPKKRIHFNKLIDGEKPDDCKNSCCNFDCCYVCFKIDLPNDITWI